MNWNLGAASCLARLPRPVARWALGWLRQIQHSLRAPAMVRRVLFVNYATYLGRSADDLTTADGPVWMAVIQFGDEWLRLDRCEVKEVVAARAEEVLRGRDVGVVLIDRSLLRGFGASEPSHPAHHSSFSLWVRMGSEDRERLSRAETFEREVGIQRDAYV